MFLEKGHGPVHRQGRACLVERPAQVTVETMVGIVDMDRQVRMVVADRLDMFRGDVLILLPEMQHDGAFRCFRRFFVNAPAIVADGRGDAVQAGGGNPGKVTAPAVADDRLGGIWQRGKTALDILQYVFIDRAGFQGAALGDVVRCVAKFRIRRDPVEQGRGDTVEPVFGKAVAHRFDVRVDAENLLQNDKAALRDASCFRLVGRELMTVGCRQFYKFAHFFGAPPLCLSLVGKVAWWPNLSSHSGVPNVAAGDCTDIPVANPAKLGMLLRGHGKGFR